MTNTERRNKFNAISAHFTKGAAVGIRTTEGCEEGTVDHVGWCHDTDTPFVAVRVPSRFADYAIARMAPANVYKGSI